MTEPTAPAQAPDAGPAQAKECVLCDRVLALAGVGIGLVVTAMAVDLLTGGRLSGALGLGRARGGEAEGETGQ